MKYFSLSILSKDELYTSSDRIQKIVGSTGMADPFIGAILPVLQKHVNDLGVVLGKYAGSEFTTVLANSDEGRDVAFTGLRDYCKAFTSRVTSLKLQPLNSS